MKTHVLYWSGIGLCLIIFWNTVRSLDFIADVPQNIRYNVEEFLLLTASGANAGQTISLRLVVALDNTQSQNFVTKEIQHLFERDHDILHVPFKADPAIEDCNQETSTNPDLLCQVKISVTVSDGGRLLWSEKIDGNIVKKSENIYIQTSKPIYFPGDEVLVRFIALDHQLLPVRRKARLSIQSPAIGDNKLFQWKKSITFRKQPWVRKFIIPEDAVLGTWTISASFVSDTVSSTNEDYFFTVAYARTPSFEVAVKYVGSNFIVPRDDDITVQISARTFFGEPIDGNAYVSFGLVQPDYDDFLTFTHIVTDIDLVDTATVTVSLRQIVEDRDWVTLAGMRLVVISSVTEYGSGETQTVRDDSVVFSNEPYGITFIDGEDSFQPGAFIIANAQLTFPNGSVVVGAEVDLSFTSVSATMEEFMFHQSTVQTCSLGTALARIQSPANSQTLKITASAKYFGRNSEKYVTTKTKILHLQGTLNGEYIEVVTPQEVLQADTNSVIQVYATRSSMEKQIHYYVTKNGKLMLKSSLTMAVGTNDVLIELPISRSMSPLVVFTAYYFSTVSHSLILDRDVFHIEASCSGEIPAIAILNELQAPATDTQVDFEVTGEPSSLISIVAVDAAVESMKPEMNQGGLEISRKIFNKDRGTSSSVICKEGRTFVGTFEQQNSVGDCTVANNRARRNIIDQSIDSSVLDIARQFKGASFECCLVGARNISSAHGHAWSCDERLEFVVDKSCRSTFFHCCKMADCFRRLGEDSDVCTRSSEVEEDTSDRSISPTFLSLSSAMRTTFILEKNMAYQRKNFNRTWFFIDFKMSKSGRKVLDHSSTPQIPPIPDTISQWNVDIFSTSAATPLCFGEQLQLPVQHYVYTRFRIPKTSVVVGTLVAGEVIVYNHLETTIGTHLILRGDEGLCGGDNFGEGADSIPHTLQPSHGNVPVTHKIFFTAIPLRAGKMKIKIKLLWRRPDDTRENVDEVVETLSVIPAGTLKREVKWILEDTRHKGFAIRRDRSKEKSLPVSDDAIPGSAEIKVSVHSVSNALLAPPDLSSIEPSTIQYHLYRLHSNTLRLEYLSNTLNIEPKRSEDVLAGIQESYNGLLAYVRPVGKPRIETQRRFAFSFSPASESLPSLKLTSSVAGLLYRIASEVSVDENLFRGCMYWILDHQKRQGYFYETSTSEEKRNRIKVKTKQKKSKTMSKAEFKVYITGAIVTDLASIKTSMETNRFLIGGNSDSDLEVISRGISRARSYMRKRTKKIASSSRCRSTTALSVAVHALQLTEGRIDSTLVTAIKRWRMTGSSDAGEMWWIKNCIPAALQTSTAQYDAESNAIEATANMLSLAILRGSTADGYANWLMYKRNTANCWLSIPASLAAMESLGQYARLNQTQGSIDIQIQDPVSGTHSLHNASNSVNLGNVKRKIKYTTRGEGQAWIKIASSYYTPAVKSQRKKATSRTAATGTSFCIYDVDITLNESRRTFNIPEARSSTHGQFPWDVTITVGIRDEEDNGGQYQSYVLDINLPAGSNVVESDLSKLFNPVEHVLDHYRMTSKSVLFYVTGDKSVSFRIVNRITQGDPIPVKIYPVSAPELVCTEFYNFPGLSTTIQTFCSGANVSSQGVCVCAHGKTCPTYLKPKKSGRISVQSRIDLTCDDESTFAFKIDFKRKKIVDPVWFEYDGVITAVYRSSGIEDIRTDVRHGFWMKRTCKEISAKRSYLVIGKTVMASSGLKYKHLLDENSRVELWPKDPGNCATRSSSQCTAYQKLEEYEYRILTNRCGSS